MIYLLDTNVCAQYLRGKNPHVLARLKAVPARDVRLCSVVAAELYYGCLRSSQPEANRIKVDEFLQPYTCLPFDNAAADHFARIRHELERAGTPIGPYDLQIAAIALAQGLT